MKSSICVKDKSILKTLYENKIIVTCYITRTSDRGK